MVESKKQDQAGFSGSERILFVDDEVSVAAPVGEMLSQFGYDVETSTNPNHALTAFRADPHRFDLLITDMTMPDLPGDDLAREVMRIRPDMPVIICTGFNHWIDEFKADAMGVKGLIPKPFTIKDVAKVVREVLDRREDRVDS